MNVTHLGHSCLLVELAASRLLFNPFISPNELASAIDVVWSQGSRRHPRRHLHAHPARPRRGETDLRRRLRRRPPPRDCGTIEL
jgi:L-ascorbate metabolism protein UlaG (beta-lactamase superfamily)